MIPIPENIFDEVDKNVREYNNYASKEGDVPIQQIWYNNGDFEEEGHYLFFITETRYSESLEDNLSELELKISRENPKFSLGFLVWPCSVSKSSNYGFVEKVFDYT